MRVGYTSSGQPILVDEVLEQLVEAAEDGIVTVQLVKDLIASYLGHSYEEVVVAVNNSKEKENGQDSQEDD